MPPLPDLLYRALLLGLIALVALGFLALIGFAATVRPVRYVGSQSPADLGWPYEAITFRTDDGLALHGWYIPRAGGSVGTDTIVVLHGYPFDKANLLRATAFLHEQYDLFLFDFRHFGASEGHISSVGYHERRDLLAALAYLRSRGIQRVGVWGFSMGGAVALMALPEAPEVRAVVADSPYADLHQMTLDYYGFLPGANRVLTWYTDLLSRLVFGVALHDVAPHRAVAEERRPILLIHGDRDATIPPAHFERLRSALANNPAAEFWLVEGQGHTQSVGNRRADYERRVLAFFTRYLAGSIDRRAAARPRQRA